MFTDLSAYEVVRLLVKERQAELDRDRRLFACGPWWARFRKPAPADRAANPEPCCALNAVGPKHA